MCKRAAVAASGSLAHLNLLNNNIGVEGAKAIAAAVAASGSLAHLTISGNDIGDEGAKAIATAVAATTLCRGVHSLGALAARSVRRSHQPMQRRRQTTAEAS